MCEPFFKCELFNWCELAISAVESDGRLRLSPVLETFACISFLSLPLTHENLLPVPPSQRFSLFLVPAFVCRNLAGNQPPVGPSLYCRLLLDIRLSFAVIALFLSHTRCAFLCVSLGSCPESGCLDTPGTDFTGPVPSNRRLHRKML